MKPTGIVKLSVMNGIEKEEPKENIPHEYYLFPVHVILGS
jgi:hypothetical protein